MFPFFYIFFPPSFKVTQVMKINTETRKHRTKDTNRKRPLEFTAFLGVLKLDEKDQNNELRYNTKHITLKAGGFCLISPIYNLRLP